jgi:hypothetical protein
MELGVNDMARGESHECGHRLIHVVISSARRSTMAVHFLKPSVPVSLVVCIHILARKRSFDALGGESMHNCSARRLLQGRGDRNFQERSCKRCNSDAQGRCTPTGRIAASISSRRLGPYRKARKAKHEYAVTICGSVRAR